LPFRPGREVQVNAEQNHCGQLFSPFLRPDASCASSRDDETLDAYAPAKCFDPSFHNTIRRLPPSKDPGNGQHSASSAKRRALGRLLLSSLRRPYFGDFTSMPAVPFQTSRTTSFSPWRAGRLLPFLFCARLFSQRCPSFCPGPPQRDSAKIVPDGAECALPSMTLFPFSCCGHFGSETSIGSVRELRDSFSLSLCADFFKTCSFDPSSSCLFEAIRRIPILAALLPSQILVRKLFQP